MAQPGLKIKFEAPCRIALAGAAAAVTVNQVAISNPSLLALDTGDLLEIGAFHSGARLYLCIEGGFRV
jgi:allophanate hydrolase subunit 2